jgi:ClpP class serine protease
MYLNILNEISQSSWAMRLESFSGLIKGVKGDLSVQDYELFHKLDQDAKAATLSFLGQRVEKTLYSRVEGGTGSLFIDGPIIPRATWFSSISGVTSIDVLTDEFLKLEANSEIEKIVLVMDSPGGSVTGVSEFAQIVAQSKKPVESINLGLMASAAYWIGSAANKIYSVDTGLIGSIGTILAMPNPEKDKIIITSTQSPNKNMDVTTKEGRADAQRIVDDLAEIFISTVAKNRGIKRKTVLAQYGKGAVFVANDAQVRGMIDGIVSLRDFMSGASLKTEITEAAYQLTDSEDTDVNTKTKTQESFKMKTLAELLAENSGLAAEIKALESKAYQKGFDASQKSVKSVIPYLTSDAYGKPVQELACKVLIGDSKLSALQSTITVLDSMREAGELSEAAADTEVVGEIVASDPKAGSLNDGSITTEEEFEASVAEQRSQIV